MTRVLDLLGEYYILELVAFIFVMKCNPAGVRINLNFSVKIRIEMSVPCVECQIPVVSYVREYEGKSHDRYDYGDRDEYSEHSKQDGESKWERDYEGRGSYSKNHDADGPREAAQAPKEAQRDRDFEPRIQEDPFEEKGALKEKREKDGRRDNR